MLLNATILDKIISLIKTIIYIYLRILNKIIFCSLTNKTQNSQYYINNLK